MFELPTLLPPYSYVPGGPWPHPVRDPAGHMAGAGHPKPTPIPDERQGRGSPEFDRGIDLFDRGFYWEAHEVWEGLWHAHGRTGPTGDLLRALIKLAAAGVKVREGRSGGVASLASRASDEIALVDDRVGPLWLGLDLRALREFADVESVTPTTTAEPKSAAVVVVFSFRLESIRIKPKRTDGRN